MNNHFFLKSNLRLKPITIYSRYEFVQKSAEELFLEDFSSSTIFNINAFTVGVARILFRKFNTDLSIGGQVTLNFPDKELKLLYGDLPVGAEIYIKINPASMGI
jgi:hypothetical protein